MVRNKGDNFGGGDDDDDDYSLFDTIDESLKFISLNQTGVLHQNYYDVIRSSDIMPIKMEVVMVKLQASYAAVKPE
jgi:hypothetical protein